MAASVTVVVLGVTTGIPLIVYWALPPMVVLVDETVGGTEVLVIELDVPLLAFLSVVTAKS
jgi:hypothetical protein